jgi:plasmid stabilization system protein ParE
MVRQIIWGRLAQKDRLQILNYWENRNKSKAFIRKLNLLFKHDLNLVCNYPFIGKPTNKPNIRIKIVKEYLLVYEIHTGKIVVLRVWDSRRNPKDLLY